MAREIVENNQWAARPDGSFPKRRLGEWLLAHRWLLVGLWGLLVLGLETWEHQVWARGFNAFFWWENFFYGLAFPLAIGIILTLLQTRRADQSWLRYRQNLRRNLRLQLVAARDRDELAAVLLQFLRVVLPIVGASIVVDDPMAQGSEVLLAWSLLKDGPVLDPASLAGKSHCGWNEPAEPGDIGLCTACGCLQATPAQALFNCHCLRFQPSTAPEVGAHLYFPRGHAPDDQQISLLSEVAPDVATAFERAYLLRALEHQLEGAAAEQQRLARDVHDHLGHSLAFLHLQLDRISLGIGQTGMDSLRREVEAVRDVASEAYDQMREVLAALTPESDPDFAHTLLDHAEKVRQRASFALHLQQHGEPRSLPALTQRHVLSILLEALTNVERHARARQVEVEVCWQAAGLELEIADDGQGFEAAAPAPGGHFGLANMQARAQACGARLTVASQVGRGTRVRLSVPYEGQA